MKKSILHLDLDTFFVSVERLLDSRLQNRPLLVGGLSERGVVAACSYETRRFGVHSGMAMKTARQLCPEAIVIKGNAATYTKHSKLVTDIIRDAVPVFEKASVDEFYADLTGMDRFFGTYKFAGELRQKIIKESGLPISIGLSQNKVVSKIATDEAKPNNQLQIPAGGEKSFLAPLSIRKIPMVGNETYRQLHQLGIERIQTLQEMPVELLQTVLGKKRQNHLASRQWHRSFAHCAFSRTKIHFHGTHLQSGHHRYSKIKIISAGYGGKSGLSVATGKQIDFRPHGTNTLFRF